MSKRKGMPSASSEAARKRMQSTRRRDTAPEMALRAVLYRMGLRYRVDRKPLPDLSRRADVVFTPARVAVYVDGCFWHGCPIHGTWPKQNAQFWREKIEANRRRDADTDRRMADAGWLVIRVWGHEDPGEAAERVAAVVRSRRTAFSGTLKVGITPSPGEAGALSGIPADRPSVALPE
jgi:DNA mismatch endonuclease (patch repair protein)